MRNNFTPGGMNTPTRYIIDSADPDDANALLVIEHNWDLVNQFVEAQRTNYRLGSVPIHRAFTVTPDIAIRYQNIAGMETVLLSPYPVNVATPGTTTTQPQIAPQTTPVPGVVQPIIPPLCALVLYKSGSVAAFDMSSLKPGNMGSLLYQGVSSGSSWGSKQIPVCQLDFGGGGVILTPVNFKGSVTQNYQIFTASNIFKPQETSQKLLDYTGIDNYIQTLTYPTMNGTKNAIYTTYDMYSFHNNTLVSNGDNGVGQGNYAYAVDTSGTYYYCLNTSEDALKVGLYQTPWTPNPLAALYDATKDQFPKPDYPANTAGYSSAGGGVISWSQGSASVNSKSVYSYFDLSDPLENLHMLDGTDFSFDFMWPEYVAPSSTSSADKITLSSQHLSGMYEITGSLGSGVFGSIQSTGSISVFGETVDDPGDDTGDSLSLYTFPLPVNGKYYYARLHYTSSLTSIPTTITTPYGTHQTTISIYTDYPFTPWMHVSNGKHYMQGYVVDSNPYLYLDGSDVMGSLTQSLNCSASDIYAVFFDIPLNSIQSIGNVNVTLPTPET